MTEQRKNLWRQIAATDWDIIVVGGGITGAAWPAKRPAPAARYC